MNELENNIVRLRAPEPADVDVLYRWENDTAIWRVSGTVRPYSRYAIRKFVEASGGDPLRDGQLRLMIDTVADCRTVGAVDLFDIDTLNHRAGIGILIADSDDRGHGFALAAVELVCEYAFETLRLHQLWADIPEDNTPSLSLFKKYGFREAGRRSDWIADGDGYKDVIFLQYSESWR